MNRVEYLEGSKLRSSFGGFAALTTRVGAGTGVESLSRGECGRFFEVLKASGRGIAGSGTSVEMGAAEERAACGSSVDAVNSVV
jgi:hypothetical protein